MSGCCTPSRGTSETVSGAVVAAPAAADAATSVAAVTIPAGESALGSDDVHAYPGDGEGPVHRVSLAAFGLAPYAVTNAEFRRFVEATGHRTEAERFGWSFVFAGLLPDDFPPTRAVAEAPWWRQVEGATWRTPRARSRLAGRHGPPGRPRLLERRRRLLRLGRRAPAHRGRVGVRRPRRPRGQRVPLGRRARARRRAPHERLAGHASRRTTPSTTAISAPRRSMRSRPTASASTT